MSDAPFRSPHGPNGFRHYLDIHARCMRALMDEGVVLDDDLDVKHYGPHHFRIFGPIVCRGGIIVSVNKTLTVASTLAGFEKLDRTPDPDLEGTDEAKFSGDPWVQTRRYNYNASIRRHHTFIRYDDADHHVGKPGHLDRHHRHEIDWRTGRQHRDSPFWVGEAHWPTLMDFIHIVDRWREEREHELPPVTENVRAADIPADVIEPED